MIQWFLRKIFPQDSIESFFEACHVPLKCRNFWFDMKMEYEVFCFNPMNGEGARDIVLAKYPYCIKKKGFWGIGFYEDDEMSGICLDPKEEGVFEIYENCPGEIVRKKISENIEGFQASCVPAQPLSPPPSPSVVAKPVTSPPSPFKGE